MSRRSSILVLVLASCGGAEHHDATTPADDVAACPSDAAPERCRELAESAASAGKPDLAWAYTVLECESPGGAQCTTMWQRYAKLAPTQTDALNVLHAACDHLPAACAQLAAWHTERGHALAAAAYQKRVDAATQAQPRTVRSLALATDLATVLHVADTQPRTDRIAQMVGRELRAPATHAVASTTSRVKAWPMHAAEQGTSSDACASTAQVDRHPVPLVKCVSEVRPFEGDQIAIRNRCNQAVNVSFAAARADHSTYTKQIRLEPYEALAAGISHRELGQLTYAVCGGECRVTSSPDDVTASWTAQDARYFCSKGGQP